MSKPSIPKGIILSTIVIAVLRDFVTDDTITELSVYVIAGVALAVAWEYVFDRRLS